MNNFKLSDNIDKNKIFMVNLSEIEGRLDAEYYVEDFDFSDFIKFRKIANAKGGKRIPKGLSYSSEETKYIYLRVVDLNSENSINWKNVKYISKDIYDLLKRYETVEGDLVFSNAGTIGKVNIIQNIPKEKKVILTENAARIIFKDNIKIAPKFVEIILKTKIMQKQISLNCMQTTIPKIGLDRIENLFIPKTPQAKKQQKIIKHYEAAYSEKQQKETKAKTLLDSIDGYLLNKLDINLPKKDNSLQNRMFQVDLSQISGGRIDPDYHSKYYQDIEQEILKCNNDLYDIVSISSVVSVIASGKTPSSSEYSKMPTEYPVIKVGSYTDEFIDLKKVNFTIYPNHLQAQQGDIFILSAAHQAEYVGRHIKYLAKEPSISTSYVGELICVRTVKEKCNSMYLFSLLNTEIYKTLLNREKTGQTSHIYGKNIKKIKILLPDIKVQNKIAEHISCLRDKSEQLQIEAKEILENAKQEVEKMILGEKQ